MFVRYMRFDIGIYGDGYSNVMTTYGKTLNGCVLYAIMYRSDGELYAVSNKCISLYKRSVEYNGINLTMSIHDGLTHIRSGNISVHLNNGSICSITVFADTKEHNESNFVEYSYSEYMDRIIFIMNGFKYIYIGNILASIIQDYRDKLHNGYTGLLQL